MSSTATHSTSRQWLWSIALWGGFGLFDASQTVFVMRAEGMHHYWYRLFWTTLVAWLPWMLATPLVLRLSERYPATQWRLASTWIVHLVTCATLGLAHAGWVAMWESLLNPWAIGKKGGQRRHFRTSPIPPTLSGQRGTGRIDVSIAGGDGQAGRVA